MNMAPKNLILQFAFAIALGLVCSFPAFAHDDGYWRPRHRHHHHHHGWHRHYYAPAYPNPPVYYAPRAPVYAPPHPHIAPVPPSVVINVPPLVLPLPSPGWR